ncbi:uncharacterized protein J8A68_003194 [[Candida] subhashii]|uniref:Uncharacterized protein n=1 Tax=[Candida] subhashii TaxID=561895 RepID=A0A8J5QW19_9ASCO|nr:uncharacterized protein J8A68_003194 [[Candida] subhashii]KAG7663280.1 hypothetical protein J8A68_003194 [[Candida] subhashii]
MSGNVSLQSAKPKVGGIPAITGELDYSKAFHIFPESLQPFRNSILAYSASLLSTTAGYPVDSCKSKFQVDKSFSGYGDVIAKTYAREGIRGFFRGIMAPLISTSFSKSISISIFTAVKPYTYTALYESRYSHKSGEPMHPFLRNIPVCFISGAVAGGAVSLFACPFEFTKIYAQLQKLLLNTTLTNVPKSMRTINREWETTSTRHMAQQIVKYEGLGGLYSGFRYHLLRDSVSTGFYYSIYESMKWMTNYFINKDPSIVSPVSILLAGGISGVFSWILIYPIDTTKTLIQKDVVTNILRREQGLDALPPKHRKLQKFERRLYRGLGISVSRSFVVNMVFFYAFEVGMTYLA